MRTKLLKFSIIPILLALLSLGIHSCKDDPDTDDTSGLSQRDSDFARDASGSNIAQIEFGRLAVQKSLNDSLLMYAEEMIDDHTAAQSRLDSIARNLNLALPDSMSAAQRTNYTFFSGLSGFAFDSAYIHNQVILHQNTRDLLQNQIDRGSDSALVNYARIQLPGVIQHHERAIELRTSINEDDENP